MIDAAGRRVRPGGRDERLLVHGNAGKQTPINPPAVPAVPAVPGLEDEVK
ncbi:MAG: hypothetical protein GX174_09260 [Lentisphaerae bacterium]|nr:hypothetical protein [Lentisphaerota bacterium]